MVLPARQQGFSLIEILLVLVLLTVIAGLVVPNIIGNKEKANRNAAQAQIQRLSMAIDNYYLDNGSPPERLEDLIKKPGDAANWVGPYAKRQTLKDPWQNDIQYRFPGEHGEYDLYSYGGDKTQGGEGRGADITSWDEVE
jgi:general secretion pathway protein G